jgi:branched-chain amino acid aminotransferase
MSVATGLVYISHRLVPKHRAKVSVFDRGFLYGEGLFETLRIYSGRTFRLDEHLNRLIRSAKIVGLNLSYTLEELKRNVYKTIKANHLGNGSLRLSVSQGERGVNLVITTKRTIPYSKELYRRGFKAKQVTIRRNEFSSLSKVKSMNFLEHILARREAQVYGADEGILLNTRGYLAEGAMSNIFLISKGNLLTPSEESGILPGITRRAVLEIAPRLGLRVYSKLIHLSELKGADEAFLTNSLMEVMPLIKLDGKNIGRGVPGKTTQFIHHAYKELLIKNL